MKINRINFIGHINKVYKNNNEQSGKKKTKAIGGPIKDRIELSKLSKEIRGHIDDIENTSIDNKGLERIKNAINAGTYEVSSEQLAEIILERIKEQHDSK